MKKRILTYINTIDTILETNTPDTNYHELAKEVIKKYGLQEATDGCG